MASGLTAAQIATITSSFSPARMGTFALAPGFTAGADVAEKYSWHALTSGAFFVSLHMCEVAVRNGVDTALTATYGRDWPWQAVFENSLPNPPGPYFKPKSELRRARAQFPVGSTGKVIAELKFAFWCHLFTSRYQNRIWDKHIKTAFPNLPAAYTPTQARAAIQRQIDPLRKFRNRIAHHEPILTEPLPDRKLSIDSLISWRCQEVANWHSGWEIVSANMLSKP